MIRSKSNSDYKFQRRHNDSWLPTMSDTFDVFTQTSLQWMEQQMKLKLHRFVTTDNNLNILYVCQTIQIDIHFATRIENKLLKNVERKHREREREKKLLQVKMLKWKRFKRDIRFYGACYESVKLTIARAVRWQEDGWKMRQQQNHNQYFHLTHKQHFVTNFIKKHSNAPL